MKKTEGYETPEQPAEGADTRKRTVDVRHLAGQLLTRALQSGRYIDHLLEASRAAQRLSRQDRALLLALVNGVLRHLTYLDLLAKHYVHRGYASMPVMLKNVLRLAIYQLVFMDKVPAFAAVDAAVRSARRVADTHRGRFVNAVLRHYLRQPWQPEPPAPDDLEAVATYYSHPLWIVERFRAQYGKEDLIPFLQANNTIPSVTVHYLKPEYVASGLPPELKPVPEVPQCYRVASGVRLEDLPGWQEGACLVQDAAAGLVVQLVGARPGERIIDLCAAPGGKALALAARVGLAGGGIVEAVDISARRMRKLQENAARLGMSQVRCHIADARHVVMESADAVLIDAPCTGTGVLGRRADLRWQRGSDDLATLVALQKELLRHGAKLVRKGGRLIYATCSLDFEENEAMVAWFLRQFPHFTLERADTCLPQHAGDRQARLVTVEGYLKSLPHVHGFDGAFAARFRHGSIS